MIFVPLLHYFKCKNLYSGNEAGMRYLLTPTKRTVPDPEGGEGPVGAGQDRPRAAPPRGVPVERRGPRRCRQVLGGSLQRRAGPLEEPPLHPRL